MRYAAYTIYGLLILLVIGGAVFLATWNIPAPTATVQKVLPDDRFPR